MCGILLNLLRKENSNSSLAQFVELIKNRGPDSSNFVKFSLGENWICETITSILWTQGNHVTNQPLVNSNGSFLLWNGDVFDGMDYTCCDSEAVFSELLKNELATLSKIRGPYAFIYYNASSNMLWFGRDPLGRHSLLWKISSETLLLTSVCPRLTEIDDVPYYGIFKIDLSKPLIELQLHPWSHFNVENCHFKYSFKECTSVNHPSFIAAEEYNWFNKEPEPHEISFWNDVLYINQEDKHEIFNKLVVHPKISNLLSKIGTLLTESVRRRVQTMPKYCSSCISKLSECNHSKIAISFSGGLDSTILSLLTHQYVPKNESIDLFNVAFVRSNSKIDNFLVPDRKSGHESLKELSKLAPDRKWNFVEINIGEEELREYRDKRIADLIYPMSSVLDDSLGCALWFATRGSGIVNDECYTSPARIVLLGMGADEVFGGYSRHRKEFNRNGWCHLGQTLFKEIRNIGYRNLGRDNRVVTDHGRQPRVPFLDEDFLEFALLLPPWLKCWLVPTIPPGLGDKFLLRTFAWSLGLRYSSCLPKKALQFGSKIANSKEKGHEKSQRLLL